MNFPIINVIITVGVALGAYKFHKYFLNAYLTLLKYHRQGAGSIWRWTNNAAQENTQNAIEKGNYFHVYTEYMRKNPGTQWIAENNGPNTPTNLVLANPKLLNEFLGKVTAFPKAPTPFTAGTLGKLMTGSIFFAEGDFWSWKRKTLGTAFNMEVLEKSIPAYVETFHEVFGDMVKKGELKDQLLSAPLTIITAANVGKLYFGKDYGSQTVRNLPITQAIKALLTDLLTGQNAQQCADDLESLRVILADIIKARKDAGSNGDDILGLYLNLREKEPDNDKLSNDYILGEFVGLTQAGTDTVTYLLNSAIYFLWKYPEAFARVKAEIEREFADPSKITTENLNRMNYTTAFLKETMRLGGPGSNLLTRIALEDTVVDGFKIYKGTTIRVVNAIWYSYEKLFSSPEVFDPERFLDSKKYDMVPQAYIPFSTGPRTCLGERFAMNEAKVILSMFVKTFNFTFPPKTEMILVPRFAYQPMNPFMVTLEKK